MPKISEARLKALEEKIKNLYQPAEELAIPQSWLEFARLSDISSQGKIQKFEPYPYQLEIEKLMRSHSCIFIKGRQLGITETVLSIMLHRACLNRGYNALVFSKGQADSSLLALRCRRALEGIGIKLDSESLSNLRIRRGGSIRFLNSKPESSRSAESITDILYDECAFVDDLQALRDAATPTQSMLGELAREYFISTPNGRLGLYFDLANGSNDGRGDIAEITKNLVRSGEGFKYWIDAANWAKILIHYKAHPVYSQNPNFLEDINTKKRIPWGTINREHNLSFDEAESGFFTPLELQLCIRQDINLKAGKSKDIYIHGIDPNAGGEDYFTHLVLRLSGRGIFEIVAWYRKNKGDYLSHVMKVGALLEKFPGVLGIESNASGRIYAEMIGNNYAFQRIHTFNTGADNKGELVERLKYHIELQRLLFEEDCPFIADAQAFREIKGNLINNSKSQYQAADGCHDDAVMGAAMALAAAEKEGYVYGI